MSAANPKGRYVSVYTLICEREAIHKALGQEARRNLSGRAIISRPSFQGWPFEFIGFFIAQMM